MLLSSLRRVRLYCAGEAEDPIADELKNNRTLQNWLATVSSQVENYLSREIEIKERTEYKNIIYNAKELWIDANPIIELSMVSYDTTGLWDGSESDLTDFYIGANKESVVLGTDIGINVLKGVRIIYTGGLAYHAVNSTFIMAVTKTWTVDNWIKGSTSGAVGRVSSSNGQSLVIENYYGVFEKDETITEYTDIDCIIQTSPAVTTTISNINKQSLAEAYPSIVAGVEAQIRYYWKHMTNFENISTDKEGNTVRHKQNKNRNYPFIDEVLDLLEPYRRAY